MKGQAEFIILLTLVVLVIAVLGLVLQSGYLGIPGSIGEEQRIVEASIENLIRRGADDTLRVIELQGGYLETTGGIGFAGTSIPYWQACQSTSIPQAESVKKEFESGLRSYIKSNIGALEKSLSGMGVVFGEPAVSANILRDRIIFIADMSVQVEGYESGRRYSVTVPTRFGEIYDFAVDFASHESAKRELDKFTKISLYLSRHLPTIGSLTSCGERIYISKADVGERLADIAAYTAGHTFFWGSPSVSEDPANYFIYSVNGKKYPGLEIRLLLPYNLKIDSTRHVSLENDVAAYEGFPLSIPACVSVYHVRYDVGYPVIINVKDDLSGHNFNFASYVYLKNSEPSSCSILQDIEQEDQCRDLACTAKIAVLGSGGPLTGAAALFGGCEIGMSGVDGIVEGNVMCGSGGLEIFLDENHTAISTDTHSSQLNGTYFLKRIPELTFNFRELGDSCFSKPEGDEIIYVVLRSVGGDGVYVVGNTDSGSVPEGCENISDKTQLDEIVECMGTPSATAKTMQIPPGKYNIHTSTMDPGAIKYLYSEGNDILSFPVESPVYEIDIGEKDRTFVVYIQDTEDVYAKAVELWNDDSVLDSDVIEFMQGEEPFEIPPDDVVIPAKTQFKLLLDSCGKKVVE